MRVHRVRRVEPVWVLCDNCDGCHEFSTTGLKCKPEEVGSVPWLCKVCIEVSRWRDLVKCKYCMGLFNAAMVKGSCCDRCREIGKYRQLEMDLISGSAPLKKEEWENPKKPAKRTDGRGAVGCSVSNRFAPLQCKEKEVIVAGSSNVNRFSSFIFRNSEAVVRKSDVTFACLPGARTEHFVERMKDIVSERKKAKVYLHVGTNDVVKKGTTEIVKNMKRIVRECKTGDGEIEVAVCSIPPRFDQGDYVFSKSISVNHLLSSMCKQEGAEFLDLEPAFGGCRGDLMGKDGVHYSRSGSAAVGKYLAVSISSFLG